MKEGEPHAEAIVRAVSQDWDPEKLIEVADPRMLKAIPESNIKAMIQSCSQNLGSVKTQKTIMGSTGVATGMSGEFASYMIDLEAEKGSAHIKINLQKVAGRWNVLGFWIQGQSQNAAPAITP